MKANKLGGWLCALAALGCLAARAAVQTITITESNAYAYSSENRLACDSGSRITVKYSYRADGTTLKAALLDFIDVTPPAAGAADPWVSIQLYGDNASETAGLDNDVDFTGQPYLWLSSNRRGLSYQSGCYNVLNGLFTPDGDTYRLGYGGTSWTGESGLLVTNLTDNPLTGAARSVLVRGTGTTCFRKPAGSQITFTGPLTVDASDLCFAATEAFPGVTHLVLTNGARLVVKSAGAELPATLPVTVGGSAVFYVSGGNGTPHFTINGDVRGTGTISVTDQGALWFCGTNNTFSGSVEPAVTSGYRQMQVGNGTRFSWGTATFWDKTQVLALNTASNVTFAPALPKGGRVIKQGKGRLTLASPLDRSNVAAADPALEIQGGALVRGAVETVALTGLVSVASGATFDLGGLACASCYLPYGAGAVSNAPSGTVTYAGAPTNDVTFTGRLFGDAAIAATGAGRWCAVGAVGRAPVVEGDLTLAAGTSVLDAYVATGTVTVAEAATFAASADEINHRKGLTGLAVDIWKNVPGVPSSSTQHQQYLQNCLDAIASRVPDVRTDMTKFTLGVHSGDPVAGSTAADPFAQILGDPCNSFAALFSGWFYAATAGDYVFRVHADDSGMVWVDDRQVMRCTPGSSVTGYNTPVLTLAQGWHRFRALFGEESGWEVFVVYVRRPGETEFSDIRLDELAAVRESETRFAALAGTGTLALASAGSFWPQADDTAAFAGRVRVDANTAGDVGTLALHSATLAWQQGSGYTKDFWTASKGALFTVTNGAFAVRLLPDVQSAQGILASTARVKITGPWRLAFDYSVIKPYPTTGYGDGLFVGLHGGAATDYSIQEREGKTKRLDLASAYGFQTAFYASGFSEYCWVKTNYYYEAAGAMTTNTTFKLAGMKENPVRMTLSYDGSEKMVMTLARGATKLAFTNACAAADLAELFPDGTARLCVWGGNGWNYASTLMENISYVNEDDAAPGLGGTLELRGGTIAATGAGVETCPISADICVKGAVTWANGTQPLALATGQTWRFALEEADTLLTYTGPVAASAVQATAFTGAPPWPTLPRCVADFTGATGTLPDFLPAAAVPADVAVSVRGGRLYVFRSAGTLLLVR